MQQVSRILILRRGDMAQEPITADHFLFLLEEVFEFVHEKFLMLLRLLRLTSKNRQSSRFKT